MLLSKQWEPSVPKLRVETLSCFKPSENSLPSHFKLVCFVGLRLDPFTAQFHGFNGILAIGIRLYVIFDLVIDHATADHYF